MENGNQLTFKKKCIETKTHEHNTIKKYESTTSGTFQKGGKILIIFKITSYRKKFFFEIPVSVVL
jgi:hypothetical protein